MKKLEVKGDMRKSNITFFPEAWVHEKLHPFITEANKRAQQKLSTPKKPSRFKR